MILGLSLLELMSTKAYGVIRISDRSQVLSVKSQETSHEPAHVVGKYENALLGADQ